ncbi:MAG TPA: LysE family transporter [Stellaceae bacterium]|nr:LysE family transporter [Stellaceae bacterium]
MLLTTLLKGIVIGIVIALPVGPVGVLCVRRTLFEGPAFGIVSGLGAATADTIYAIVAGFGLTVVREEILAHEHWLGALGGVFLLYLGINALLRHQVPEAEPLGGEALLGAYASTFALTITNPITILAFAAIFAQLGVAEGATLADIGALVLGVFLGSLLWWLGISFGFASVRHFVGRGFALTLVSRITGSILTLSGAALLAAAIIGLLKSGR